MAAETAVSGIFVGETEETLLSIKNEAVQRSRNGGAATIAIAAGQKSRQLIQTLPVDRIIAEARYALQKLDPDTYGRRIRKTYAFKRGC